MPLKALAGADQYLSDALSTFIKSQQESLYTRWRDSLEGHVVTAISYLGVTLVTMFLGYMKGVNNWAFYAGLVVS